MVFHTKTQNVLQLNCKQNLSLSAFVSETRKVFYFRLCIDLTFIVSYRIDRSRNSFGHLLKFNVSLNWRRRRNSWQQSMDKFLFRTYAFYSILKCARPTANTWYPHFCLFDWRWFGGSTSFRSNTKHYGFLNVKLWLQLLILLFLFLFIV